MKVIELAKTANKLPWIRAYASNGCIKFYEKNGKQPFLCIKNYSLSIEDNYSRLTAITYLRYHELIDLNKLIEEFIETPIKDRGILDKVEELGND